MSIQYLKVKIWSLAEESKYIRKQEHIQKNRAKFLRDHLNYDRRVAWHTKQIERLQKEKLAFVSTAKPYLRNFDERIQWHDLEIKRLYRQHNQVVAEPSDVAYAEKVNVGLHEHRVGIVRSESRAACIAYAFLKGYAYCDVEASPLSQPNWGRVHDLVMKYGECGTRQDRHVVFMKWLEEAKIPEYNIGGLRFRELMPQGKFHGVENATPA